MDHGLPMHFSEQKKKDIPALVGEEGMILWGLLNTARSKGNPPIFSCLILNRGSIGEFVAANGLVVNVILFIKTC